MIQIGTVKSIEFRKNKDGDANTAMLQVELSEPDDIQSVELFTQPGQEVIPENGDEVIVIALNSSYRVAIAGNDQVIPSIGQGERLFYSTLNGVIKAQIYLTNQGKISIGNGVDELLSLFNDLLTELQKTVDSPGASSTGTLFKINPALAIIQSKLSNIKI